MRCLDDICLCYIFFFYLYFSSRATNFKCCSSQNLYTAPSSQSIIYCQVHNSICSELIKVLDKIGGVLPAIESARPGYTAGIQELCSLNNTIEKAKLLIQHCAECSMLYLVWVGYCLRTEFYNLFITSNWLFVLRHWSCIRGRFL